MTGAGGVCVCVDVGNVCLSLIAMIIRDDKATVCVAINGSNLFNSIGMT